MRNLISATAAILTLSACSSPPMPPTVDAGSRRPVNTALSVEVQTCRAELHNTRIRMIEANQLQEVAKAVGGQIAALQQAVAAPSATAVAPGQASVGNTVFTIHFAFGSTRVVVPPEERARLIESARHAPLVMLRGRTDGTVDSVAESRIARDRARAVRDYLIGAGVEPDRIRATYQPIGDPAGDGAGPSARGLNRRVEVEVYRALPVSVASPAPGTSSPFPRSSPIGQGGPHGS